MTSKKRPPQLRGARDHEEPVLSDEALRQACEGALTTEMLSAIADHALELMQKHGRSEERAIKEAVEWCQNHYIIRFSTPRAAEYAAAALEMVREEMQVLQDQNQSAA